MKVKGKQLIIIAEQLSATHTIHMNELIEEN